MLQAVIFLLKSTINISIICNTLWQKEIDANHSYQYTCIFVNVISLSAYSH